MLNQIIDAHRVLGLAKLVADTTGADVAYLPNPRREAEENDLIVRNDQFLALEPIRSRPCMTRSSQRLRRMFAFLARTGLICFRMQSGKAACKLFGTYQFAPHDIRSAYETFANAAETNAFKVVITRQRKSATTLNWMKCSRRPRNNLSRLRAPESRAGQRRIST